MRTTTDEIVENAELIDKTIDRDERDSLNRQSLIELMLRHNITIPTREFDQWRPTVPTTGRIEGVSDGLTCIMTNGLLGYFLRADREPLYGHIAHFMWDHPVVSYIPYLTEQGEEKFFKSEKQQGAPSALWKLKPKAPKVRKTPKKTPQQRLRIQLLESI